jgi:hypothetical protein
LEFGDFLLPFYFLVFVRECVWGLHSQAFAWTMAIAITLAAWFVYLFLKPTESERTPKIFWLIVALPFLIMYAMRFATPDLSFDVLNHRLIQGERALRGAQFIPGDFFPNVVPLNPSSDMLTGLFRHAVGYRLGTIVNLLALLWAGTVIEKILRPRIARNWLRCLAVFLVLFTEHMMFELSTYMVDLLALPLLLEALRLGLAYDQSETKRWNLLWSALLLGIAVGLKLTNAALVLPILLVFIPGVIKTRSDVRQFKFIALAGLLFLLPLLPHAIYVYRETGSPFFPMYNNIFQSRYWSPISFSDGRWGPKGWRETLLWPLLTYFVPRRLSELAVYSGRLTLGFVTAIFCLLAPGLTRTVKTMGLVTIVGSLLWSATSGYVRYALLLEILGGILVINLSIYLFDRIRGQAQLLRAAVTAIPICFLAAQIVLAVPYIRRFDWSLRPTPFDDPAAFRKGARWILRDRDLWAFQGERNKALFSRVDAWIVSDVKTNGPEVLLRPNVPMLGVNYHEYFAWPEGNRRFSQTLEGLREKRLYTLILDPDPQLALEALTQRKLIVGDVQEVVVPFFSTATQFHMKLVEVIIPPKHERPRKDANTPVATKGNGRLEQEAYRAELTASGVPSTMRPGESATIIVTVKNISEYVWPSLPGEGGMYEVTVADVWLESDAKTIVNNSDARSSFPHDTWPDEIQEIPIKITAPARPGDYVLEIDLVQEGVTFFKDQESRTWQTPVKVQ